MATIERFSEITGKVNKMEIPGDPVTILGWIASPPIVREHVQDAFPDLTPDQREFLLTGVTPDEWDEIFPEEDEEDF